MPATFAHSSDQASTVTLLIAPPSARSILDALTDLSSMGLVSRFAWIEADNAASVSVDPRAVVVDGGRVSVSRSSHLTNRHGLSEVRMVFLVMTGEGVTDTLNASTELSYQSLGVTATATKSYFRLIIPWGTGGVREDVTRQGWTSIVLSPEHTAAPSYAALGWWDDAEKRAGSAAVAVAAHAGLAGSVQDLPRVTQEMSTGRYAHVARSFVRMVDATEVENQLKRATLDLGARYPAPTRADTNTILRPFGDAPQRVEQMSQAWYERHRERLRRPIALAPQQAAPTVTAWAALGMFFSFMLKVIMGAPAQWLRSKVRAGQAAIASTVNSVVFGPQSTMRVVVGGVDQYGNTLSWEQLSAAAKDAVAHLPESAFPTQGHQQVRDYVPLWQDMLEASRGLLDGAGCDTLGLPAYTGFVADPELVSPVSAQHVGFTFPQPVGLIPAGYTLAAWDDLAIQQAAAHLSEIAPQGGEQGVTASRLLNELDHWRQNNARRFVPSLGMRLAQTMNETRADIRRIYEEMEVLSQLDLGEQQERAQRRLGRRLLILLLLTLLVLGGLTVAGVSQTLTWLVAGALMGASALVWLVTSLMVFIKGQREAMQLIYRSEQREQRLPALAAQLRVTVEDLAAQGEAYQQFLAWARIVTTFVAQPLGRMTERPSMQVHDSGLPEAMTYVRAHADAEHLSDVAQHLRSQVFTVGWLRDAWSGVESSMRDYLTPEQRKLLADGQLNLYADSAQKGSALANLADGMSERGVLSQTGEQRWEQCLRRLLESDDSLLTTRVTLSTGEELTVREYRSQVEQFRSSPVVKDILSLRAQTSGDAQTTEPYHCYAHARTGLSTTMVLTDATMPLPEESFQILRSEAAGSAAADWWSGTPAGATEGGTATAWAGHTEFDDGDEY